MNNRNDVFHLVILLVVIGSGKLQTSRENNAVTNSETTTDLTTAFSTTTCAINNSCFDNATTTILPVEHVTDKNVNNSPIEHKIEELQSSIRTPVKDICICDLTIDFCDLNCCCDRECSSKDKQVFGHCEEDFHEYDTRFCQFKKHVYINKTLHEYEVNQDGLFCVVRNNLPPTYISQRKQPLRSIQEAEIAKINQFSWPIHTSTHPQFRSVNYTYGERVWIIQNQTMKTFQIDSSFFIDNCLIRKEVKYLEDVKNSCSRMDLLETNSNLDAQTYFANITIIAKPQFYNISSKKGCPRNVCIIIEPKICDDYFEKCSQVTKNDTRLNRLCHFNIKENIYFCINLVKSVKYDFYHNGTEGIIKVNLFIILKNVSVALDGNTEITQIFEVNFIWGNHTLNYSSYLSGNPGYLVGKPLLTANLISFNLTTNTTNSSDSKATRNIHQTKLFRNPSDFTNNFMVLPQITADGDCVLNKHEYSQIEFGFNLYTKCTVKDALLTGNTSAAHLCKAIQRMIFNYWNLNSSNNTLNSTVFGHFGNANVHNRQDWLHIMFKHDLNAVLNRTLGVFDHKSNTLNCVNLSTLFLPEIYYSRVDFEDVANQNKILGVVFNFEGVKNISFAFNSKEKYTRFSVKISTKLTFFDITTKKTRRFVDPPSLNIKLPHDFFYPFVKLDNSSGKPVCVLSLVLITCIVLLV